MVSGTAPWCDDTDLSVAEYASIESSKHVVHDAGSSCCVDLLLGGVVITHCRDGAVHLLAFGIPDTSRLDFERQLVDVSLIRLLFSLVQRSETHDHLCNEAQERTGIVRETDPHWRLL